MSFLLSYMICGSYIVAILSLVLMRESRLSSYVYLLLSCSIYQALIRVKVTFIFIPFFLEKKCQNSSPDLSGSVIIGVSRALFGTLYSIPI